MSGIQCFRRASGYLLGQALSRHAGESEVLHGAGHVPSILLNEHMPQSEVEMGGEGPPHLSKSQFPHSSPK